MFVLTVHEGATSRDYPLKDGETLIGRGPHCDIVLTDDSISRNHARIVIRGDSFVVADLGSSNGTYCNGEPVKEQQITGDERLLFGSVEAVVSRGGGPEAPRSPNPTLLVAEQRVRRVDELPGASNQVAAL